MKESSYVSMSYFEFKALPVRICSFSPHTFQLSTAMLLPLMRNDNDNDPERDLRATGTTS